MRNYDLELRERVAFIQGMLKDSGAAGIVFANSGGKDSALVGILCKRACRSTTGVMLPCSSSRNYEGDMQDAQALADQFGIANVLVDLGPTKAAMLEALKGTVSLSSMAEANIAPRLRMASVYAVAQSTNCLVAGTGNRSEGYVGYFTKWGDGAHDFNPIADLTVREIYEFLRHLGAPQSIIDKHPSAGLFEGQTDEGELGFTYDALDTYLLEGKGDEALKAKIESMHMKSEHKRRPIATYGTAQP